MTVRADNRPLIAHVLHRFDVGGLENGVVNLINHMEPGCYRHAVIALDRITEFRSRIRRDDVTFVALEKPPGHAAKIYPRLHRLFSGLAPDIVHSRNLAALEVQVPAWTAGVPVRIHGEHGRDVDDLDGKSRKHRWIRRVYRPFVHRYVTVSRDLQDYLVSGVGVAARHVEQIYNGVDTARFRPGLAEDPIPSGWPFARGRHWVIGSVGRLQAVKDHINLARAFAGMIGEHPQMRENFRLAIVGDGALRAQVQEVLASGGVADIAWMAGERADVPELMRMMDCFVLPSQAEGISNTVLEAMASGLPVIATRVGGNAELVLEGRSGLLVPPSDPAALAQAMLTYAKDPRTALEAGVAGRARVEECFSLPVMTRAYMRLYDELLERRGRHVAGVAGGQG